MRAFATAPLSVRDRPALVLSISVPLAASLAGIALAVDTGLGIALTLALLYLPIALMNLQMAVIVWLPLIFLEGLSAFNLAAKAGGLVIAGAWFVALARLRDHIASILQRNAKLWLAICGLLLWYSLSLLWADDRGMVLSDLWHWYAVALLMLIVATTVSDPRSARWLAAAFVLGAVLAVGQGVPSGGMTVSTTAIETASQTRLEGGQGDPNFLAAGIVPAMVLAVALLMTTRHFALRWALVAALVMLALGLAASQSRGGAVAALAASLAAFIVFEKRRRSILALGTVAVGVVAAWFAVSPGAWERVSTFDRGGSGRSDLWTVAWRMGESNPIQGTGLYNFPAASGDYVREPGTLERLDLIVDRGQVVHNVYLQLFAETGVIGLGLFLAVAFGSLAAAWRAARWFEDLGDESLGTLSRGVVVATIGLLAAATFISNGVDKRLWTLFALGPALLGIAAHMRRTRSLAPVESSEISDASAGGPPVQPGRP